MQKIPVTVLIPTINAAGHLEELLDSIQDHVEDIFIVDSRSLDDTVNIALKRDVKIIQRPFKTSSDQFRWMFDKLPIKTPWVLFMAQDERMSESLRKELSQLLKNKVPYEGYTVKWRLWFMGKPLHVMTDNLRLFKTGKGKVTQVACNEHFFVDGSVGKLKGILEHKDTLSLFEWYEKQNLYTTREAIGRIKDKNTGEDPDIFGNSLQRRMYFKRFLYNMPFGLFFVFLYYFFFFGAWRDGYYGFMWAKLRVWAMWVVKLKMKEFSTGVPLNMQSSRHGDFDVRIMGSKLQKELLPEIVNNWKNDNIQNRKYLKIR